MKVHKLDISKFLPHRPPFLMVDQLISIDDNHVSTTFKIKPNCIFLNTDSSFNEIGLLENAAQTCSAIVGKSYFEDDDLEGKGAKLIGFISAIKEVVFIKAPKIGETIFSTAILKSRSDSLSYSICKIECKISDGKNELFYCQLNLFIQKVG